MRLKLWAAFAASSLVGITLISAPVVKADTGDRFGNSEESGRKGAEKSEKSSEKSEKSTEKSKGKEKDLSLIHI